MQIAVLKERTEKETRVALVAGIRQKTRGFEGSCHRGERSRLVRLCERRGL